MLALEIDSDKFSSPILALVKVVWCKPTGERYRVGGEFWWTGWRNSDAQASIAKYVAEHTTPHTALP
jgi:hypothetical protein